MLNFLNIDLALEPSSDGWRVHVLNSPVGQAARTFAWPVSPEELSALFSLFGRTAGTPRSAASAEAAAKTFGQKLYDAMFAEGIQIAFLSSIQIAANQGAGLRLRLWIGEVPALADLPWELLHDGQDFLALSTQRALVRYLELAQPIKRLRVAPPLRVLVILSNASDYPALDGAREWQRLNDTLADVSSTGLFEVERLERATLADLQQQLRKNEYHILHFSGHGEFNEAVQNESKGALIFEREDGRGQAVDGIALGWLLRDHPSMRLVVLNACEGARAWTRNAFAGAAQTLIRQSIPAVIAMQFELTLDAAQVFAKTLYAALADGFSVDAAMGETRKALASQPFGLEWATPVLFTRTDDGILFDLTALSDTQKRALRLAALLRLAEADFIQENFPSALERVQRVLDLDPDNASARAWRERIQTERELAQLYTEGKKYFDAARWSDELDYLRRIQSKRFGYRDTDALVPIADRELQNSTPPSAAPRAASPRGDELETHYAGVVTAILNGRLVPFLGVGVNLVGRPHGSRWSPGQYVPDSGELTNYLAAHYHYPNPNAADNLAGVSQYIAVMNDEETLKGELHTVLDADYPPTRLHRFLATMALTLRDKGYKVPFPIIVSTTYDDILERTFRAANEPFELVTYIADGEARGNWWHHTPDGQDHLIDKPNQYADLKPDQHSVILKIHGAVDRADATRDSYVITEDHYIDYLTSSDISSLIPVKLQERFKPSSFLFLGYSLRDWNLRVLLYRIWGNAPPRKRGWAVQAHPEMIDNGIWQQYGLKVVDMPLEDYLDALETRVRDYPRAGTAP